ncbi:mechanosensitive ion channel family protein [Frateuria hangzhouensis]|uniref:mechanosensitive ion channel family protein n=1 Tax=Frateuria hangzhouensis TaxID=2995589 RepID=UPI002260E86A|nr:mechanosensitive ion channel domain-containing protein [Frateuria sp. STR12]MCX7512782.1 mechanosensitive ion channel [Frateuria sp. STR12]
MPDLLARIHFSENATRLGINILVALLILLIGTWLAARVANLVQRAMQRASVDATLIGFLRNLLYGVLVAVLVVSALITAGVPSAPLVAALGASGLAIGLALQGSLSNLAWGVLLIVFRPFRAGDFVHAGGVDGTVETVNLMYTLLVLPDNREAIVPNAKIGSDAIINANRRGTRRFELKVGIGYKDDIGQAIGEVERLFAADSRILDEPPPSVVTGTLAESSVDLIIRAWTRSEDLWATQTELLRSIKERFADVGISIPYPQRELTVVQGALADGSGKAG